MKFFFYFFIIVCTTFFQKSFSQNSKLYFQKSLDADKMIKDILNTFIAEASHTNRYDSLFKINSHSKKKYDINNFSAQILSFEQDLYPDTLVQNFYTVLISKQLLGQTGHKLKIVNTQNFLLRVLINENFSSKDFNFYMLTHKNWSFYSDTKPWCNFPSYKKSILIEKCIKMDNLLDFLYKDSN